MAYAAKTVQPSASGTPQSIPSENNNNNASLLAALVLSVYAAQKGNKQLRKLKRKAALTFLRLKLKESFNSLFSRKAAGSISTTTLLYILLGLLVLILLLTLPPVVAIIVLLVGILLILLSRQ